MKTLAAVVSWLFVVCALVLAQQQQPDAAKVPRRTIGANVAAGLLCGSSEPTTAAKDEQENVRKYAEADTLCGPVPPPLYPAAAKQKGIQGTVRLKAVIGTDGTVRELRLIEGHPLLAPAAIEVVKRWKYKPYRLHGKPVEVETNVTVNFRLEK